jgi:hypothetical protein
MATQIVPTVKAEEALATVQHYIDAFNKGDVKAMAAAFATGQLSGTVYQRIDPPTLCSAILRQPALRPTIR